jgi:hypothetical protein
LLSFLTALRQARLLVLIALLGLLTSFSARASVGVVLNESLDESMDRITGTGHTAVYFSNICPESPIRLRLCRPGELGSVMSTYINIGEDLPYEWNIVPLNIYLYGVEDPKYRSLFGSNQIKQLLEARYRDGYLSALCTTDPCQTSSKAEWREMVAATMIRSVYIFAVDTSEAQDLEIISKFNDGPNKNNFNGVTRNCADFTRAVIDSYFPGAVYRDVLNDFGMTSPKAVAHTFTRYALRHPESNFRVMHFAQVPGTINRSREVRSGTEELVRSKKFIIPMAIFAYQAVPFVAGSYLITGRFNPEHTFEKYPALDSNPDVITREQFIGTAAEWKQYKKSYTAALQRNKSLIDSHDLSHFFKYLDQEGTASLEDNGSVWMTVTENNEPLKVGLSANNALAAASNPQLAYKFFLVRTGNELKSPKHGRETMQEFHKDWSALQQSSNTMGASLSLALAAVPAKADPIKTVATAK